MLKAQHELINGMRRLLVLTERLSSRAGLSADEARDGKHELDATRESLEQFDAMPTLRRQQLWKF